MRKSRMAKKLAMAAAAAALTLSMSMVTFAGQWRQNNSGWWYDNGNGTWPASCWQWIDGNGDGTAECYYFDQNGYCLMNTTAPGGQTVNASGTWTNNGKVQTLRNMKDPNTIYENCLLSVSGVLEKRTFRVGEDKADTFILKLDEPMTRSVYSVYEWEGYSAPIEIDEIQILFLDDPSYDYDRLIGNHIEVSGSVMVGHSAYHIRTIVLCDTTASVPGMNQ